MYKLFVNPKRQMGHINPELQGHFSEHLGRCIYEGLYVGENSEITNTNGMRNDVVAALKEKMDNVKITRKAMMEFNEGEIAGKKVVVVRSGIGKVNAAICTQILVDDFQAEVVINTGIAGSLNADINIGDIVLSTDVLHHDVDATGFGYPKGQIPQMEEFSFQATVLEVHETYLLVEPGEETWERSSSDKIEVSLHDKTSWPIPQVGDTVNVFYNGELMETYPARVGKVYRVEIMN